MASALNIICDGWLKRKRENDIKSLTQVSLTDASTTIKREMPLRNDRGKPAHNWNKLCAVVLGTGGQAASGARRLVHRSTHGSESVGFVS